MPSFTILLREEGTKGGRNGETRPSTQLARSPGLGIGIERQQASCPPFEIEAKLFGISTVFIGYCSVCRGLLFFKNCFKVIFFHENYFFLL